MNSISTRALDIFGEWASAKVRGQTIDFTPIVGNDAALRSEVERLIADSAPAEFPPDTPRYMFRTFIARGGMGEVWRAFDLELRREVAVKLLKGKTGGSAAQFLAEAQLMAKLEHPAIVPVYDTGALADGRPFFVMKLIQGKRRPDGLASPPPTLEQLLKNRSSPLDDLPRFTDVFQQICGAVAYAHAMKPPIMHRDLKPSNVMVGLFGEVLVTDWGLAKALFDRETADAPNDSRQSAETPPLGTASAGEPSPVADTRTFDSSTPLTTVDFQIGGAGFVKGKPCRTETRAGAVKGTPAYMAPEQARGQNHLIGPASDVFALGGILCRILTGQPVYMGEDITPYWKAGTADLDETYARLDGCGADPALVAIARRCLSPEIADRPADAGELARLVADYRAGVDRRLRQIELDQAAREAKAAELRKRHRNQALLGGTVLVVLALLVGNWLLSRARLAEEAEKFQIAETGRVIAERNQRDQEEMAHLMRGMELVSSRRGNWTENAPWEFRQAKHIAANGSLAPQIRAALVECVSGTSLDTPERLEPQAKISASAYSADGRALALADRFTSALAGGSAVYLHDTATGKRLRTVVFPKTNPLANLANLEINKVRKPDGITALTMSRDGRLLVAGTKHGRIHVANLTTEPPTLTTGTWPPTDGIARLEISADAKTIHALIGTRAGRLAAIDPKSGEIRRERPLSFCVGFATDPADGDIVAVSDDHLVRLDPATYQEKDKKAVGGGSAFAVSRAGDMLAFANGKQLFLMDARRREVTREFRESVQSPAHLETISGLLFDPAGRFVVSSSEWSNEVKFWDITTGAKLFQVNAGRGLSQLAIHPAGTEFTVGSENGALRYRVRRTPPGGKRLVSAGMLANFDIGCGEFALAAAVRRPTDEVRFEEWGSDAELPKELAGPGKLTVSEVESLDLSRWGRRTIGYAANRGYGWFDADPPEPVIHDQFDAPSFLQFGFGGEMWVGGDEFLRLSRPGKPTLKYRFVFDHFTKMNTVTGLGVSGKNVLVGMRSGHAWVFPTAVPTAATKFPTPTSIPVEKLTSLRVLAPLDDETWLVGTRSGGMHRFGLNEDGDGVVGQRTWIAHDDEVTALAVISPQFVATGGRDRTLALWRLTASGEELLCRWPSTGSVRRLRYDSATGRLFWLNNGEHGLHKLDLPALWKKFDDHGVGLPNLD